MTTRPRSVTGPLACLLAALVLVGAALVAAPAATAASWTTVMGMHGAEIQVCKVPLDKGWKLKARLVNNSGHGHRRGVSARRDGKVVDFVTFRVLERRTSKVKSLVVKPGNETSAVWTTTGAEAAASSPSPTSAAAGPLEIKAGRVPGRVEQHPDPVLRLDVVELGAALHGVRHRLVEVVHLEVLENEHCICCSPSAPGQTGRTWCSSYWQARL